MLSILLQPYTLFIIISLVPTCLGFKYLCLYRNGSWRTMHMHLVLKMHKQWNWWLSSYMSHVCWLVILGRLTCFTWVSTCVDFCLTTMCVVHGFRLVFSRLFWMACKSIFECTKMQENSMCFDEAQDVTVSWREKRLCCH